MCARKPPLRRGGGAMTAPTAPGRPQASTQPEKLTSSALMRECGSKTGQWHPESPQQWRWQLANAEGPERALAWVKLHSIALGSPVCVNAKGDRLRAEHMAADLKWGVQTARNVCTALAKDGLIRLHRGTGIFYRADVPERRRTKGEAKSPVHGIIPTYIVDLIRQLPRAQKTRVRQAFAFEAGFMSDVMAAARLILRQVQHNTLLAAGVAEKLLPPVLGREQHTVALSLVETPAFLKDAPSSVQVISPVPVVTPYAPKTRAYTGEQKGESAPPSILSSSSSSLEQFPPNPPQAGGTVPAPVPRPLRPREQRRIEERERQAEERLRAQGELRPDESLAQYRERIDAARAAGQREEWRRMYQAAVDDPATDSVCRQFAEEMLKKFEKSKTTGGGT